MSPTANTGKSMELTKKRKLFSINKLARKSLAHLPTARMEKKPEQLQPQSGNPIAGQNLEERMLKVEQPDGRMSSYPPVTEWDNWTEWDSKQWPKKVKNNYRLIPTICFNCESACGLLAYVNRKTHETKKFEGNPFHPGSRGRNCAKGPATLNQIQDPERILYPLKRTGPRGSGQFTKISWEQALNEIAEKMRNSLSANKNGIMYHVGRPGEDHYANRCIKSWGVDGHNSHTNICSAGARAGYAFWAGFDRPSPDYANAKAILLISSHLETGHYFNPHAQRIIEAQTNGAKIITMDPRLSNTASKSDVWLSCWPGSEAHILLAIANNLIAREAFDHEFVEKWTNWQEYLEFLQSAPSDWFGNHHELHAFSEKIRKSNRLDFSMYVEALRATYSQYTFEAAAKESRTSPSKIQEAAEIIANCDGRLAAHTWRSASIGNLGGWQVARSLFFLNVLTGSVGKKGGTFGNSWNKYTPKPFKSPPTTASWNPLLFPDAWPLSFYEMSFVLPHLLEETGGSIDVYFTRVYNPMWINPDGFMWMKALQDEHKVKCHVALTPTWNETAWYADYILPMGHASERHDLMSQETHNSQWIGFRQPVERVSREKDGQSLKYTYQSNPGEVWEEAEFWVELAGALDPKGDLGIRQWYESPSDPSKLITQDEYWGHIFENEVPGLPEAARELGLSALQYMKRYGCFEIRKDITPPFSKPSHKEGADPKPTGFDTPSRKLEFFSKTLGDWGWDQLPFQIPWPLKSHVHPEHIDHANGEMLLLPNFRLPTLIHTRSANCKWLYEISHNNPVWMNPLDAIKMGVTSGDLIRVDTEIGYFVDKVWLTEGIKPGIIAMSHHLGRWRLVKDRGVNRFASSLASLASDHKGEEHKLSIEEGVEPYHSEDPDTQRIWWDQVGVHQNLTHAVHPDPISGAHCWLQKATSVRKANADEKLGDVWVDTKKSMAIYKQWKTLAKPASKHSPNGERRPYWLKRPLKPNRNFYKLEKET